MGNLKHIIIYIFRKKPVIYACLTFWGISTVFPLLWITNNSFKTSNEIFLNSMSMAKAFKMDNFLCVLSHTRVDKAFLNSMIISGAVVFFSLLFGGFSAFAIARFNFKAKRLVKLYIYIGMLVPQFTIVLPVFWILRELNAYGSRLALIIPQTACNVSFAVILLVGFMVTIPKELEEAAFIEGCSVPEIFRKIIVPISKPAFITTAIVIFLWSYNDLLLSLVYLPQKHLQPICVILANASSMFGINYGAMMAAVLMTIVPIMAIYLVSQEYIVKGLTEGILKG